MNSLPKLAVLNRYYRITRFYDFLKKVLIQTGIVLVAFILILLAFEHFVMDAGTFFNLLISKFSSRFIFIAFFTSEIIMGLVPPELFIAWGLNSVNPWLIMFLLATLSYIAGVMMYFLGNLLFRIPAVKRYLGKRITNHIVNLREWGGFFIFIGAMFPVPHAAVSFTSGLIKFRFKHYLLWALFRYLRFFIFAFLILNIL